VTPAKKSYEVHEPTRVQRFFDGEELVLELSAGPHVPKNEREEELLEQLVATGQATSPDGRRWKSPLSLSAEEKARLKAEQETAKAGEGEG
jgi:hypothetical protein